MKRSHFINLIICITTGLLFSLGMCMCLLPEWNLFVLGVVFASLGGGALLVFGIITYIKNAKNITPINWKMFGKIVYIVAATLILGLGMCFILVWELLLWGILTGIVGLIMLLFTIPMFFELKK